MTIRCLRTGKALETGLSLTEATASMLRRIRAACADWEPANIDAVVAKYQKTGRQPFMFAVFAN